MATGGNEALAKIIFETCLEESPKILEEAKRAISQRDFATARRCGHSLKSSFGAIGATRAAEASEVLEFIESSQEQSLRKRSSRFSSRWKKFASSEHPPKSVSYTHLTLPTKA